LSYKPGNPSEWKVEFDSLGEMDMRVEGFTPKPNASLHPALRDFLRTQLEVGIDILRVYGPVISDPICSAGSCRQWTAKARFEFDQAAVGADAVQRLPIGLWLTYPGARSIRGPGPFNFAPLLGAGVLVLLAVLSQMSRKNGARYRATTT
jgi:hypothetical protein